MIMTTVIYMTPGAYFTEEINSQSIESSIKFWYTIQQANKLKLCWKL